MKHKYPRSFQDWENEYLDSQMFMIAACKHIKYKWPTAKIKYYNWREFHTLVIEGIDVNSEKFLKHIDWLDNQLSNSFYASSPDFPYETSQHWVNVESNDDIKLHESDKLIWETV